MAGEPTFVPGVNPAYPIDDNRKPRVLMASFGDGYAERVGDGINTDRAEITLSWEALTTAESNVIFNFLKARKGYQAFYYQPQDWASTVKWICPNYKRTLIAPGLYEMSASFQQVFDA